MAKGKGRTRGAYHAAMIGGCGKNGGFTSGGFMKGGGGWNGVVCTVGV